MEIIKDCKYNNIFQERQIILMVVVTSSFLNNIVHNYVGTCFEEKVTQGLTVKSTSLKISYA